MHQCEKCKYYYETLCRDSSQPLYNALMDAVMTISVDILKPCCGYTPGGVILDPEAPRCKDFEENKCEQ